MVGDFYGKYWPINPTPVPQPQPTIIQPVVIPDVQEFERLREIQEILKRVKELEDKLGCPCDDPAQRGKPEYIKKIQDRLDELEKKVKA
jgi:tetrahydromethanopterin S-methyltransferase subunit G